ncbi:MAG: 16S rRNA (uracil(1498)-N(3))-methyltransferase [Planctomycetes bacterium]|nr:16S rRNA (uracil(1498)-N(3))-methyltransferase [Planctomycetota bacterium]
MELPADEAKHARVLRLKPGAEIELFDQSGRAWSAALSDDGAAAFLTEFLAQISGSSAERTRTPRVILATAWPKGKRAAVLVEKCAELGVAEIVPLRCGRSVVVKDDESEGVERLRRIAAEAAKQSGRTEVPALSAERSLPQIVGEHAAVDLVAMLDPRALESLAELLAREAPAAGDTGDSGRAIVLLVGPEGGFTREEEDIADQAGVRRARLGRHVLRIETACIAACAICAAVLK